MSISLIAIYRLMILRIKEHKIKAIIFTATMVEPTGVEYNIDTNIPTMAQITEIIAEQITTPLKCSINFMDDNAGKITNAEINKEPTKFIPSTIITEITIAIKKLYPSAFIPVAFIKFSSKVTAKKRL